MTDPNEERRARDRSIGRMSRIAFILAFLAILLGIIMNWPRPAPAADATAMTRSI